MKFALDKPIAHQSIPSRFRGSPALLAGGCWWLAPRNNTHARLDADPDGICRVPPTPRWCLLVGRQESPGAGVLGNAFISALRSKVNKNVQPLRGALPRRPPRVDVGANGHERARPVHDQQLARNTPRGAGRLFARLRCGRPNVVMAGSRPKCFGLHQSPAAGGSDQHHRGGSHSSANGSQWGRGPITNFNPAYNDRTIGHVPRPTDPVCKPRARPRTTWSDNWFTALGEQLYPGTGHGQSGAELRPPASWRKSIVLSRPLQTVSANSLAFGSLISAHEICLRSARGVAAGPQVKRRKSGGPVLCVAPRLLASVVDQAASFVAGKACRTAQFARPPGRG